MLRKFFFLWFGLLVFGLAVGLPLGWGFSQFHQSSLQSPQHEVANQSAGDPKTYIIREPEDAFTKWTDPIAIFTGLLFFVTVGLTFATFGLFEQTARLANDSEKASAAALRASTDSTQLARDSLIATNRAWIHTPEVTIGDQPLLFYEATTRPTLGASTSVAIRMTNVGNAPAIHVTTHLRMIAMRTGVYPWQEQMKLADEVKGTAFNTGRTLFPKEVYPDHIGYGKVSYRVPISKDELDAAVNNNTAGTGVVSLHVVGCIDYTFPSDPTTHHQTGFIREVCKKGSPFFIKATDGNIPATDLELRHSPMTDARPAD
jgi:hypothetical protein